MPAVNPIDAYDIETPDAVEDRFGIQTVGYSQLDATASIRMPVCGLRNPLTNTPTLAPLALLVDDAGSSVTFARRGGRWPVTAELNVQLAPDAHVLVDSGADEHVTARARIVRATPTNALAICTLMSGGNTIGTATVRSVYVSGEGVTVHRPTETLIKTPQTSLAELMAVACVPDSASPDTLQQLSDPMVFNEMAHVHGGVAATGVELAAAAAISGATVGADFRSGSLQVNFLRPFLAGGDSRYSGTVVHAGSTVAIAEAQAVGASGKAAVTGRLTAYRSR